MAAAAIEGAADGGADVLDLGMIGTEMLYFAVGELGLDGGICVTASHNPKEYTGMKIVRRGALPVGGESGLLDVRDRALKIVASSNYPSAQRGTVREEDVWPGFVDKVLSFVDVRGDPAAARRARRGERDGRRDAAAGARPPADRRGDAATSSPTGRSRTTSRTRSCPRTASSSCGRRPRRAPISAWPTTATPTAASSSTTPGEFVPGDFVTALLAESILEKEPGGKVIYDVRASWAVPETIERAGGEAADEPGRARVHQAPHAQGGRRLRRRGLGALLLPRLLAGRLGRGPVPAPARADLEARPEAVGAPRSLPRALLPHRRDQHAGRGRGAEAAGAEGALRGRAGSRTSTASRSSTTTGTST